VCVCVLLVLTIMYNLLCITLESRGLKAIPGTKRLGQRPGQSQLVSIFVVQSPQVALDPRNSHRTKKKTGKKGIVERTEIETRKKLKRGSNKKKKQS